MKLVGIIGLLFLTLAEQAFSQSLAKLLPSGEAILKVGDHESGVVIQQSQQGSTTILRGNLSSTWQMGLYVKGDGSAITIPGVGIASRKITKPGFIWQASLDRGGMIKKGHISIRQKSDICFLDYSILVKMRERSIKDESGTIIYFCSQAKPSLAKKTRNPRTNKDHKLEAKEVLEILRPSANSVRTVGTTVTNQLQYRLQPHRDALISCLDRSFNRETLKISYASAPSGQAYYRVKVTKGKTITTPVRTPGDPSMDTCVANIVSRADVKNIPDNTEKYLTFDVKCEKDTMSSARKYSCNIRYEVFDGIKGLTSH